ncbi:MAG: serine/threonine protein phosphatase, partial [Phaeodactylibacter sp.]|nr:serine/threonine protein phosphatase [Phaeodactylibacter sp.]
MSGFSKLREEFSQIEILEKELNIKNLQIKRLLAITQAINNNVSAAGLFKMYADFLDWEMGVQRMALYFKQGEQWTCTAHLGISRPLLELDISQELSDYKNFNKLDNKDHPLISKFDLVIPVSHKETPISYVFIGGFDE